MFEVFKINKVINLIHDNLLLKVFLFCILSFFIGIPAFASTYYMANNPCSGNSGWGNGSNSNAGTSKSTPKLTLVGAFAVMKAGDTLIIDDGTYTGSKNGIYTDQYPYKGSYGTDKTNLTSDDVWTTVQAENDGMVIFDGQNSNAMFYVQSLGSAYWKFKGIIWARAGSSGSNVFLQSTDYVKFINCGAYDAGVDEYNFYIWDDSYILFEGCYAYGTGRYKFLVYLSDHIILRQCVGRPDAFNSTGIIGGISVYSSNYVKIQNCIIIDGDRTSTFAGAWDQNGAFVVPTTSGSTKNVAFKNCIGLNTKLGGIYVSSNNSTTNVTFENIVLWDTDNQNNSISSYTGLGLNLRGDNGSTGNYVKNMTFGANTIVTNWGIGWPSLINTIFYGNTNSDNFWGWGVPTTNDYNSYYGNTKNTGRTGAHDLTTINPLTNSLRYLPRIESGSALKGAGSSGADIGANVLTLIGTSGTMWGETGYDTDTAISMWPFPNEDIIKTRMATYSATGITGARGFAASGKQKNGVDNITLTSYIWEYLGNQMPSGIYSNNTPPSAPQGVGISAN